MAGPTFRFWLAEFSDADIARLEAVLRKGASSYRRLDAAARPGKTQRYAIHAEFSMPGTALMGLSVSRWRAVDLYPAYVCDAFTAAVGFVPLVEVGGYCMGKGDADWDALREVSGRVADAIGGWVVEETRGTEFPGLPADLGIFDDGVREVVARDVAGYFGSRIGDAAFVREYDAFVPTRRFWLLDARRMRGFTVRK
jgi:hypothetical protein